VRTDEHDARFRQGAEHAPQPAGPAVFLIDFGLGETAVSVLYHPEWKIKHPLEDDGRAIRLWPEATAETFDYFTLASVRRREVVWRESAWPKPSSTW
jgi:hypothetical protein